MIPGCSRYVMASVLDGTSTKHPHGVENQRMKTETKSNLILCEARTDDIAVRYQQGGLADT